MASPRGVHAVGSEYTSHQSGGLGTHEVDESLLRKLWIASTITHYPCAVCWCVFFAMVILGIIDSFVLELATSETRAYFVESDPYTKAIDAWTLATEETTFSDEDTDAEPQTEDAPLMNIQLMFELNSYSKKIDSDNPNETNYWILTPENLEIIMGYEEEITNDQQWKDYYCYVSNVDTYDCDYTSVAQNISQHFNYDYSSMSTAEIKSYVKSLYDADPVFVLPSFNGEYEDTQQTYLYRSFLKGGLPIPEDSGTIVNGTIIKTSKYSNINDNYDEQEQEFDDDIGTDIFIDITVKHNAKLKDGDLRVVALIYSVYLDYFNVILLQGFNWIFVAIVLVLCWMTFHLQSFFLSCLSIVQILLSFPFAYFIYYYILGVTYYDNLSLLIVFVLLGVGADDVFVFTDAWHQSLHFVPDKEDLEQRMTFAYRRASKAMLVTQITTFFAFLATAFSLIMPISAFGLWAASIVLCNYILVITMYPALLIMHNNYILPFEKKYCCCCCHKDEKNNKGGTSNGADIEMQVDLGTKNASNGGDDTPADTGGGDTPADTANNDRAAVPAQLKRTVSVLEQAEEYRCIEKFFAVTWANFIDKFKLYILIFFAILFGLAMWQATGIEAQDQSEQWFNDDHYMQLATDLAEQFSASEEDGLVEVNLAWGIQGVNRGDSSFWNPYKYGKVVFDDDFDLSTREQQQYVYDTCNNLTEMSDLVYSPDSFDCPLNYFELYLESINKSFPWTYMDVNDINYNVDTQKEEFAWLMYNFTTSGSIYVSTLLTNSLIYVKSPSETDDGKPQLVYIAANGYSAIGWDAAAELSRDTRDLWDDFVDDTYKNNDNCPEGVCNARHSAMRWAWLRSMQEFVRSAIQGILIAMPLAFVVLLISTRNWIMACFATLDILGIMACELAVMALQGWKFGVSESIAIVIIIGFSVDYVVHLANAYLESTSGVRKERVSFALLTMGISVASGAVTTLLAGSMLAFPEVVFFQKMGILIVTTICFSLVWAMFFFISILSQWGPQYEKGNIPIEKLLQLCNRKKDQE